MSLEAPQVHLSLPQLFYGSGAFAQWTGFIEPILLGHLKELRAQNQGTGLLVVHGGGGLARFPGVTQWVEGLEDQGWELFAREIATEPVDTLLDHWLLELRGRVHRVIGIGGGSVMDAAKVMAALLPVEGSTRSYLEGVGVKPAPASRLPLTLIPTTGGTGSEATSNGVVSGVTPDDLPFKKSLRHPTYVPDSAVLDPSFMVGVPPEVTAASGMDALSQLLESHFSTKATSMTRMWTGWGLEQVAQGLEKSVFRGLDSQARLAMALGAFASGIGLANAGLGLVHGIVGTLGSMTQVPHGLGCARLLGPCFSRIFRAMDQAHHPDLPEVYRIARLFVGTTGTDGKIEREIEINPGLDTKPGSNQDSNQDSKLQSPQDLMNRWIDYLETLADRLKLPKLKDYGFSSDMIPVLVEEVQFRNSPIILGTDQVEALLEELC